MTAERINHLTHRLREGIALKLGPMPPTGGAAIDYDLDATKALMHEAADAIEALAWRVQHSNPIPKP